jgi:hypothetical protein
LTYIYLWYDIRTKDTPLFLTGFRGTDLPGDRAIQFRLGGVFKTEEIGGKEEKTEESNIDTAIKECKFDVREARDPIFTCATVKKIRLYNQGCDLTFLANFRNVSLQGWLVYHNTYFKLTFKH